MRSSIITVLGVRENANLMCAIGVKNMPWLGQTAAGAWEATQQLSVMYAVEPSTPMASNDDGRAYAIQNGVVKEFQVSSDGKSTWSLVGDVATD